MIALAKPSLLVAAVAFASSSAGTPVTRTVKLDANRFIPAEFEAAAGDTLNFVNGNGGPHNVEFVTDSVAKAARPLFEKAMPGGRSKLGPMSGPLLIEPDESYKFVVPNVPAGRYAFLCLPHQVNMKGALIIKR